MIMEKYIKSKTEGAYQDRLGQLIQFIETKQDYKELQLDQFYMRLLGFQCKSRRDLSDRLMSDLLARNQMIKDQIKIWTKIKYTQLPEISNVFTQKKPTHKQVQSFRFETVNRAYQREQQTMMQEREKEKRSTSIPLQQMHCPINNLEIFPRTKPKSHRLHGCSIFKVIDQIRILQDNQLVIIQHKNIYSQNKKENLLYPKIKQLDLQYNSQKSQKNAITDLDISMVQSQHRYMEQKFRFHIF
ncbi:hypothetical protein pb186bvf_005943 [Paramecium bursaria]